MVSISLAWLKNVAAKPGIAVSPFHDILSTTATLREQGLFNTAAKMKHEGSKLIKRHEK